VLNMIWLARFRPKIAAKAAVLIAGLGLMSALADRFTLDSVEKLERLSADVSEHLAPARLALAEAKTRLSEVGSATYRGFATTEPDTVNQAGRDIAGQYAAANNSLSNGLSYFPQRADDFNRIRDKLSLVLEIANEAQAARAAHERERAQNILDLKLEPALDDAMGQLNRLINILGKFRSRLPTPPWNERGSSTTCLRS
jgi:methyl-accepting chemotaxis protein